MPPLFALWAACAPPDPSPAPPAPLAPWSDPSARGPYAVGVTTRAAPSRAGGDLTIEVWYPALPGDEPGGYALGGLTLPAGATRDAAPEARDAPFPVVAFSHGFGGVRFQSYFLTEHLASHGFVVVAPDHPGTALTDFDPDGLAEHAPRRPADVADAVDALDAWPELRADASRYGVVGHSLGAWTALAVAGGALDAAGAVAACAAEHRAGCAFLADSPIDPAAVDAYGQPDPRAVTAAALAPGGWYSFGEDGAGLAAVAPTLVVGGGRDGDLPWASEGQPTFDRLPAPRALALLPDAGHWGFTDLCGLLPVEDCAGPAAGYADPAQVHAVTASAVTAWLGVHLLGEPAAADALGGDGAIWTLDP